MISRSMAAPTHPIQVCFVKTSLQVSIPGDIAEMDEAKVDRLEAAIAGTKVEAHKVASAMLLYKSGKEILKRASDAVEARRKSLEDEKAMRAKAKNTKDDMLARQGCPPGDKTIEYMNVLSEMDDACNAKPWLAAAVEQVDLLSVAAGPHLLHHIGSVRAGLDFFYGP